MAFKFFKRKKTTTSSNLQPSVSKVEKNKSISYTNLLIHNQKCTVEKISNRIEETGFATENLIDIIKNISKNMEVQMDSIEKVIKEIANYSALTEEVHASTINSQKISEETKQVAHEGNIAVNNSIKAMDEIEKSVDFTKDMVKDFRDHTAQIDDMLKIIKDIASLTNLLALNAAIEAARAGEHGRGFAVVADEVRKLAQKSEEAAEEISVVIGKIKESIDNTIKAMDESGTKVNEGVSIANNTTTVFNKIIESINTTTNVSSEISAAIAEQTNNLEEVVFSTKDMDDISNKILSMIEIALMNTQHTKSSIEILSQTSTNLNNITNKIINKRNSNENQEFKLKTCINKILDTLDPAMPFDQESTKINGNIHSGILTSSITGDILPGVAKSWYVKEDNLTWVFNLRRGVLFHNKKELTSEDVKFSLERILSPSLNSPNAWLLTPIEGAEKYQNGLVNRVEGIQILDKYRISIKLSTPYSGFLLNLAHPSCAIINKDDAIHNIYTGCGTYFISNQEDDKYILTAFKDYYGGQAYIDTIEIYFTDEEQTKGFMDKKYDFVILGNSDVKELRGSGYEEKIRVQDVMTTSFAGFNLRTNSIFAKNKDIRKAINYAVNKKRIIEEIVNGLATEAKGVFPPAIVDNDYLSGFSYNPKLARKILNESDYANEKLKILGYEGETAKNKTIDLIMEDLNAIGIKCDILKVPANQYIKKESMSRCDLFIMGWIADTGDPDNYLEPLFNPNNYTNFCGYDNEEVNRLMREAKQIVNPEKRFQMYKRIQDIIIDDMPWVFMYHPQTAYIYQKGIENVHLSFTGSVSFGDIILDR